MTKYRSLFYSKVSLFFLVVIPLLLCQCGQNDDSTLTAPNKPSELPVKVEQGEKPYSKSEAGIWFKVEAPKKNEELEKLRTLGYLSGYRPAKEKTGVTINIKDAAQFGQNLIVSGHKPYAALIGMDGKILHEWTFNYSDLNIKKEELIVNPNVDENFKNYWRRVKLFDNGDLLAIYDYQALIKIDKNSHLKWVFPARVHHDLFTDENENIWVLATEKILRPELNSNKPIFEDHIIMLDSDGKEKRKISLVNCFINSDFSFYLKKVMRENKDAVALDIFHTNSIQMLDDKLSNAHAAFQKGNFLISIRELNLIVIMDPNKETIVWAKEGSWKAQHEARRLSTGNILLFDNKGGGKHSRVLEFNPTDTNNILWSYSSTPPENFYSPIVGSQQRLSNGNTLITDTAGGRAFEVTPGKKIVWEYFNPERTGKDNELIAALFDTIRVDNTFLHQAITEP